MALPPTEINPEMLNKLQEKYGVSGCKYVDVLCLESDYVKSFPQPTCALLLAFPQTPKHDEFRNKLVKDQKDKQVDSKLFYMKQKLENSSVIVAMIHTLANNKDVHFGDKSTLKQYIDDSVGASPDKRGMLLEENKTLFSDYKTVAAKGFVRPGGDHCNVIALVTFDGHLFELDGHMDRPIDHGPLSAGSFLENAVKVCKQYTAQAKDDVRFSAVALVKNP